MGRKRKESNPPEFYVCVDCGKQAEKGSMKLVSRKIELYPCGLPQIDGNILYTTEEQDQIQKICVKLGRHEICNAEMAGNCAGEICKRFNEGIQDINKDIKGQK